MSQIREDAINVYTDGSSFSSPRAGGVGVRIITVGSDGHPIIEDEELFGYKGATNNQMELLACITGLRIAISHNRFSDLRKVFIYTDSRYVTENWKNALYLWPKNKWQTKNGGPVLNAEMWKDLGRELKKANCRVVFVWVKGHKNNIHNKAVDKLAKRSARVPLNPPLSNISVRRKMFSTQKIDVGCVPMCGQVVTVRLITSEYLKVQKVFKYKYEILSRDSDYFGCIDFIYSPDADVRAGHNYELRLSDDSKPPRIVEVIREVLTDEIKPK